MIVVRSNDLRDEVLEDWSGLRKTDRSVKLAGEVSYYVKRVMNKVMSKQIDVKKSNAIRQNRDSISQLQPLAKIEISEFVEELVAEYPAVHTNVLSAAVKAAVNLEKSRSGQELLEKLASISEDDADQ